MALVSIWTRDGARLVDTATLHQLSHVAYQQQQEYNRKQQLFLHQYEWKRRFEQWEKDNEEGAQREAAAPWRGHLRKELDLRTKRNRLNRIERKIDSLSDHEYIQWMFFRLAKGAQ